MKDLIETIIDCECTLVDLTEVHKAAIGTGHTGSTSVGNGIF